jgi:hypothetical protein
MSAVIEYLEEVNEIILNPLKKEFTDVLVNFIVNDAETLIDAAVRDQYELQVINVEFDIPFSFSYVAYAGSNIIPREHTSENILIDLEVDTNVFDRLLEEKGFILGPDAEEWFNTTTLESINDWELKRTMESLWFSDCWKEAKRIALHQNTNASKLRCFFIEHDNFGGIDADSGEFLTEKEILQVLKKEGLYNEPKYDTQFCVYRSNTKEVCNY